jgi:Lipocalin-like domain
MKTPVALLALTVSAFSPALGQTLSGTWKPVEVVVDSGPDRGRHTTDVQPGLLIFTKGHYSMTFVQGFKPRPLPSDSATDEQVGLLFLPFTANAGTYERKDSTIVFSPNVAKNPAVMAGKPFTMVVRVKGDTLWARPVGGGPGLKATWVRVERP